MAGKEVKQLRRVFCHKVTLTSPGRQKAPPREIRSTKSECRNNVQRAKGQIQKGLRFGHGYALIHADSGFSSRAILCNPVVVRGSGARGCDSHQETRKPGNARARLGRTLLASWFPYENSWPGARGYQ
jgi:hypothetical protein